MKLASAAKNCAASTDEKPYEESLYVVVMGPPVEPESGGDGSTTRYARIPDSVIEDQRLKSIDVHVYSALSLWVFQGRTAQVGTRWIAEKVHADRKRVLASLKRLEANGHVKAEKESGRRTVYVLTSPVFGQKQGKQKVVVRGKSGGKVLASMEAVA